MIYIEVISGVGRLYYNDVNKKVDLWIISRIYIIFFFIYVYLKNKKIYDYFYNINVISRFLKKIIELFINGRWLVSCFVINCIYFLVYKLFKGVFSI